MNDEIRGFSVTNNIALFTSDFFNHFSCLHQSNDGSNAVSPEKYADMKLTKCQIWETLQTKKNSPNETLQTTGMWSDCRSAFLLVELLASAASALLV